MTGDQKLSSLSDIIPFGKYKGEKVGNIFDEHPHYLEWLINKTDKTAFPVEIEKLISIKCEITPNSYNAWRDDIESSGLDIW